MFLIEKITIPKRVLQFIRNIILFALLCTIYQKGMIPQKLPVILQIGTSNNHYKNRFSF